MGTRWRVCVVAQENCTLDVLHAAIQATLDRVVRQMSTWEHASDICLYNQAEAGTWHTLQDDFQAVIQCALDIARKSDGAYDPSIGPLVELWGFGAKGVRDPLAPMPPRTAIESARARVDWKRILVRKSPTTDPRMQILQAGRIGLDLSAIAKGYGVDVVAGRLRDLGIRAALVDVGGELYGYGCKPDGDHWRVQVETASDEEPEDQPCIIVLDGCAVATSGDRWHHFMHDDQRYAHTIDPRSGHPVDNAPSCVTVVAHTAMLADAWATAMTVMGVEDGLQFARTHSLAVRFMTKCADGVSIQTTTSFDELCVGSEPA